MEDKSHTRLEEKYKIPIRAKKTNFCRPRIKGCFFFFLNPASPARTDLYV